MNCSVLLTDEHFLPGFKETRQDPSPKPFLFPRTSGKKVSSRCGTHLPSYTEYPYGDGESRFHDLYICPYRLYCCQCEDWKAQTQDDLNFTKLFFTVDLSVDPFMAVFFTGSVSRAKPCCPLDFSYWRYLLRLSGHRPHPYHKPCSNR